MRSVTLFTLMAALVVTHAVLDDKVKGKLQVAVSPSHFKLSKETAQPGEDKKASEKASPSETTSQDAAEEEKVKDQARQKLEELARDRQKVLEHAEQLDLLMHEQYAEMLNSDVKTVASLISLSQKRAELSEKPRKEKTEDEQFAALEQQTNNMVQWFQGLKQLKADRDKVAALTSAQVAVLDEQQLDSSNGNSGTTPDLTKQPEGKDEQREHLLNIMASSAIEVNEVRLASDDVLEGLDALTEWKKRQEVNAGNRTEARNVKAKLSKAMAFLQEHENLIADRTNQINVLMKEYAKGQL